MARAESIRGVKDKNGGGNKGVIINRRGYVSMKKMVEEVKDGKHPDTCVIKVKDKEYVKSKPNSLKSDNLNR